MNVDDALQVLLDHQAQLLKNQKSIRTEEVDSKYASAAKSQQLSPDAESRERATACLRVTQTVTQFYDSILGLHSLENEVHGAFLGLALFLWRAREGEAVIQELTRDEVFYVALLYRRFLLRSEAARSELEQLEEEGADQASPGGGSGTDAHYDSEAYQNLASLCWELLSRRFVSVESDEEIWSFESIDGTAHGYLASISAKTDSGGKK